MTNDRRRQRLRASAMVCGVHVNTLSRLIRNAIAACKRITKAEQCNAR